MALSEIDQIKKTWERANNILVTFRHDPTHDGAASALALGRLLEKLGKHVEVVAPGWNPPAELRFLPYIDKVRPTIQHVRNFVIELPVETTPIKELSYQIKEGKLQISLTPKAGSWNPEDVTARSGAYRFDLICTVGTPDLKSLGTLFEQHTDFFYHVPIINFDHDPANEHYGQINHVDINTTAVGELLFELIKSMEYKHHIDEEVATCLLAGIITKTKSFKQSTVTPKTLGSAGELVALGAKHDLIMHHLYRTRTVPTLRLWGRALARLKHDLDTKFVWTVLTRQDFIHAGADPAALSGVIDELIVNVPDAQVACILYEDQQTANGRGVICLLHAKRPLKATELARELGAVGNNETAAIELKDKTLLEAEPLVTGKLREQLAKQNRG